MANTNLVDQRRRVMMLAAAARWKAQPPTAATTAISPSQQARFDARRASLIHAGELRMQGRLPVFIERKIGPTLDWIAAPPTEAARAAGRPVARIVVSADPKVEPIGFATGFLISPSVLLTNWHVFPDIASARGTGANFLHEAGDRGVARGITFELDPDTLFHSDESLDYAIVAVRPTAPTGELLSPLNFLSINASASKILPGMPMLMVEYPDGGAKRYATSNCKLLELRDDGFLRYETDTSEGSSGSPCFSEAWEVCALHHASIPRVRGDDVLNKDGSVWTPGEPDDDIDWIANEGIRISFVVKAMSAVTPVNPVGRRLLDELLEGTIDPADDVSKLTTQGAAEAAPKVGSTVAPPAPQSFMGANMAVTMNFSGPVTIYVGGAPSTSAAFATVTPTSASANEKSLRFDPDYDNREGYDPEFLGEGISVPLPMVAAARESEMVKESGQILILKYHHFSLAVNASRRIQMWSAVNVDYDSAKRMVSGRQFFGTDRWIGDPRIPAKFQLADVDVYGPAGQFDRGHIVRREDNAWGNTASEVEFANADTFHWTNCTPQHAAFNRENAGGKYAGVVGIWGGFEGHIQKNLQTDDTRACILAGPVLAADDPKEDFGTGLVQYPETFWKVVAVASQDAGGVRSLRTYGFLLSQKDVIARFGVEFASGEYARYQVPLAQISAATGVVFDAALMNADTLGNAVAEAPAV
ncbi:endonuclease G [Sphingomonas sp. YR710]|uniref:DNA/RNA non-specific endonuclease n=1 Tax=Sphingomonas sp. YR710 TaxID=1882773 RepID=UPI0008911BAD|nr:DNA/RNA non-specific endonuclease [Sphingomonas sp. YR710]SDD38120.1 endonuclease G [Sphingomonas sp. YR710]